MEEVVASHPAVAECAVVGMDDSLKGQVPVGFVVLKEGIDLADESVEREIVSMVRERIGPVAAFKRVIVAQRLPKTRSGKVLRGIMRSMVDRQPFQPPSTIEDPGVLDELARAIEERIGAAN